MRTPPPSVSLRLLTLSVVSLLLLSPAYAVGMIGARGGGAIPSPLVAPSGQRPDNCSSFPSSTSTVNSADVAASLNISMLHYQGYYQNLLSYGMLQGANGKIYLESDGGLIAVDPSTNAMARVASMNISNGIVNSLALGDRGSIYWLVGDAVEVINGSTGTLVRTISVNVPAGMVYGYGARAIAYDARNRYLYVAVAVSFYGDYQSHGYVSVIDPSTGVTVANVTVGILPDNIVYDSDNGYIYVANRGLDSISVIDGSYNVLVTTINGPFNQLNSSQVQASADYLTYDQKDNEILSSASSGRHVYIISGSTNTIVGSLNAGAPIWGMAYDPAQDYLYLSTGPSNPSMPSYLYSPFSGWLSSITQVDLRTGQMNNETAPPTASLVYDSSNGYLYAISPGRILAVLFGFFVDFHSNLPAGEEWSVTLGNVTKTSSDSTMVFTEYNGTYPYSVRSSIGFSPAPANGTVTVDGGTVSLRINLRAVPYIRLSSFLTGYFIHGVDLTNDFFVCSAWGTVTPVSVSGTVAGHTLSFNASSESDLFTAAGLNMGSLQTGSAMHVKAMFANGSELTTELLFDVVDPPPWFSSVIHESGSNQTTYTMTGTWNDSYTVQFADNFNLSRYFSAYIPVPYINGTYRFVPQLSLNLTATSSGQVDLNSFYSFRSPSMTIGSANAYIYAEVRTTGSLQLSGGTIRWMSSAVNMTIGGSTSVTMNPYETKCCSGSGESVMLGIQVQVTVSPSVSLEYTLVPTNVPSQEAVQGVELMVEKLMGTMTVPVSVTVFAGLDEIEQFGIYAQGTLTFQVHLNASKPFEEGGQVTGSISIGWDFGQWQGTFYSVGPGTIYQWGSDPSSYPPASNANITVVPRYYYGSAYDSMVWKNGSSGGVAVEDIYPFTRVSSTSSGGEAYIYYTSDNTSMPLNEGQYIEGLALGASNLAVSRLKVPVDGNSVAFNPRSITLPNGTVALLWNSMPRSELNGATGPFTLGTVTTQYAYYTPSTGEWGSVRNLTGSRVAISDALSPTPSGGDALVILSDHLLSTQQSVIEYDLGTGRLLANLSASGISQIMSFNAQSDLALLRYFNGTYGLLGLSSFSPSGLPSKQGYTVQDAQLVSAGPSSALAVLYHSASSDRIQLYNASSGSDILGYSVGTNTSSFRVFCSNGTYFFLVGAPGSIAVQEVGGGIVRTLATLPYNGASGYGGSLVNSSLAIYALDNYGNATRPLLDLEVSYLPITPPPAPSLGLSASGSNIQLDWSEKLAGAYHVTGYYVLEGNGSESMVTAAELNGSATSYDYRASQPGQYYFAVVAVNAMGDSPQSNLVDVNGSGVIFAESGLPAGTPWSVSLDGIPKVSNSTNVVTVAWSGESTFAVGPVPGYVASPSSGTFLVTRGTEVEVIHFQPVSPNGSQVSFVESGLALGESWSVVLSGVVKNSTSDLITFTEPNGNYTYSVGISGAFLPDPQSGTVIMRGVPVGVTVSYELASSTGTTTPAGTVKGVAVGGSQQYLVIMASSVLLIATSATIVLRRCLSSIEKRKHPSEG